MDNLNILFCHDIFCTQNPYFKNINHLLYKNMILWPGAAKYINIPPGRPGKLKKMKGGNYKGTLENIIIHLYHEVINLIHLIKQMLLFPDF